MNDHDYYMQGFNDAKLGRYAKNEDELIEEPKHGVKYDSIEEFLFENQNYYLNKTSSAFPDTFFLSVLTSSFWTGEKKNIKCFEGDSFKECEQELLEWANDVLS